MSISLEQLSAQMRRGEQVPLRHTMQVVLTLSIPSILQQIVVTAVEYIDAAMVGHIGASATASIGIVSSSTWLMHGMLAGLYMSFAIQVAQYLGADRQDDARGVLRQSMIFNLVVGLAAAAFGIGISRFLPGWLGADPSLQADASAYFAIWSASRSMGSFRLVAGNRHLHRVIFWIRWAISTSSCPLPSARWLHRCLPHPTSCPERKRTSA